MSNDWDDEEDLTVVEKTESKAEPLPEKEDETVAFARKSELFPKNSRRKALEKEDSHPFELSPFGAERFPLHSALPRDRFAAFFVDSLILFYLLAGMQKVLSQNLYTQAWFYTLNSRWTFLADVSSWICGLTLFLLYYVAFEAVLSATPGKFLCRLRVADLDGGPPTLANVFLRNLCRLFDYPLFFLVAVLSMESSRFYQRLGDRAARTVVIKKARHRISSVDIRGITLSSTFIRAFGFFLDLIFFGAFIWFYLSSMNPKAPQNFQIFSAFFPVLAISYFIIFEMLLSSTPGKIILKRQSILENGENLDNTAAIIRNLIRPLDMILAYPFLILSRRKQRLGDYLAETLVIKKEGNKESAVGIILLIAIILALAFISSRNPERKWFLKQIPSINLASSPRVNTPNNPSFNIQAPDQVNVSENIKVPSLSTRPRTGAKPQTTSNALKITEFYLSAGPDPTLIRSDALFHPGDLIFAFFKLAGFQKGSSGKVEIIEDIQIEAPNGELLIDKSDVVKFSQTLGENVQYVLFANQILLPPNPQVGTYKIILILHDENSQTQLVYEKTFTIQ